MSQMRAAGSTSDFCAGHAKAVIFDVLYGTLADRLEIAGPSCSGVKFGIGAKEWCFTAFAEISTFSFIIPVFILERGLSTMVEADIVFERCQLFLQFFPIEFDGIGHNDP